VELLAAREALVAGTAVRRALPRRGRRTVGAWCFADHFGPAPVSPDAPVAIGPHPHTGLQTVTWLLEGEQRHRDSLGSDQVIRPGQLNLMTAGAGIAHSEEDPDGREGRIHGMQLWVAQPEATRWGVPAFEHHRELPRAEVDHGTATVLVGAFDGATSPARRDTDHVGIELALQPGTSVLPLDPTYEHAVIVAGGDATIGAHVVTPGSLAYLVPGADELVVTSSTPTLALLVGGVPFDEDVVMWWNFVARSRDEVTDAYRGWAQGDERFGAVHSGLGRAAVAPPPWLRSA